MCQDKNGSDAARNILVTLQTEVELAVGIEGEMHDTHDDFRAFTE